MGASARPERPPLSEIVRRVDRPSLASIAARDPASPENAAILAQMNDTAARAKRESDRLAANARDKKLEGLDALGAIAQRFSDASTFGVSGLLDDALSPGSFRDNRQARRLASEGLSGSDRVLSTVAGALANPVGAVLRPFQGSGLLARTGNAALNTGAQAGAIGATENLMEFTPQGLLDAGEAGVKAAAAGAALGAGGSLLYSAGRGANTLRRVGGAKPIDEAAFLRRDAMREADDVFYTAVRREAGQAGSTPAIREVLESQTVKPFADMIRRSETFAGANDAEVLTEAYKLMSTAQGRAAKSIEGTAEHLADIELKTGDISLAKRRMLDAATEEGQVVVPGRARAMDAPSTAQSPNPTVREALDRFRERSAAVASRGEGTVMQQTARQALERHGAEGVVSPPLRGAPRPMRSVTTPSRTVDLPAPIPTFPKAVATHAAAKGEQEAFNMAADAVRGLLRGRSVKANKLLIDSPEALRRAIRKMTPGEAQAALDATLSRAREEFRITSNPLSVFGAVPSVARGLRLPGKLNEFIDLMERQAGIRREGLLADLFSPASGRRAETLLGVTSGSEP